MGGEAIGLLDLRRRPVLGIEPVALPQCGLSLKLGAVASLRGKANARAMNEAVKNREIREKIDRERNEATHGR